MAPKFTKTYTRLDKYGEITLILNGSINVYSRSQKERLMAEVLSKIVE